MFICPTCGQEFYKEETIRKHFLECWKEHHPYHKSKPAPTSTVTTRKVSDDVANFFNSLQEGK